MRRMRLLWQLYPSYLIITLLALFAATWYASRSLRQFYFEQAKTDLEARAHLAANYAARYIALSDTAGLDTLCKELGEKASTRITVILPSGNVIADSDEDPAGMDNHAGRPEIAEALEGLTGVSSRYSYTLKKNMMYLAIPLQNRAGISAVVRTSVPLTHIDKALRNIYVEIVVGGLIIALVAAFLTFFISHRITRPLANMKMGADRFADGHLEHRLEVPNSHEMAALAEALNHMAEHLDERIRTLSRQRNEHEAVLSSMLEALVAVDVNERLININQAAAHLMRIDLSQSRGRTIQEVVRNTDLQKFLKRALASREPIEEDMVLYDRQGTEQFVQTRGTTLLDGEGNCIGAVVVINDVTNIKKLENIRRDFVANVSHELKTPITSIKGFVETLLSGALNDRDDAVRFLDIIAKQSDRLNAIIEDLLSLARIEQEADKEQIPIETTPLKGLLQNAIQVCQSKAASKDIVLELACEEDIVAKVDCALIEQAVVNLVDNAVKYSDAGSKAEIGALETDTEVVINVRDEGCGIEKQHLDRLFERFYRVDKARSRHLGGTGLGLAIVKHIAQAHNGYVCVESTPGVGSLFSIHLPRC